MLAAQYRMRRSADFSAAVRSGRRVGGRLIVVHQQWADVRSAQPRIDGGSGAEPLVGLVVSKGVGGSVIRHRVARRLRAQVAARIQALPPSSSTVVRALPAAAGASSAELGHELDRALHRLRRPS